jgi:hypothetical protein
VGTVESDESDLEGEEDDDDLDDDLLIVGEQTGTVDSTDASSSGTEPPAKKTKITLTVDQDKFAKRVEIQVMKTEVMSGTYEIALWLHPGNIIRHTFRNH